MPLTAQDLLEDARQLPLEEQQWLLSGLLEGQEAEWRKEVGEPEPSYDEWFRKKVEESLADTSAGIPHEQVKADIADLLHPAQDQ